MNDVRRAGLRFRHLAEFAAHKTPSNALQVACNPYQRPPIELYGHHASMITCQSGRMTCGKIISPDGVSVVMVACSSIMLVRQSIVSMMPEARSMEDSTNRTAPVSSLRSSFLNRSSVSDERIVTSDELLSESDSAPEAPAAPKRRKQSSNLDEFTGSLVPAQFKLPADLVQSLKLHSIGTNESMSAIVLRCLTSTDVVTKAWVQSRKAS